MARVVLIIVAVLLIFPVYLMITGSVQPLRITLTMPPRLIPWQVTWENYALLLDGAKVVRWIGNTLIVVCGTSSLAISLSFTGGYALSVYTVKRRRLIETMLLSLMILPMETLTIPLYVVVRHMGLSGSIGGAVIPRSLSILGIFLCRNYIAKIPRELIEAGRADGAGELHIMLRLIMPICAPVLGVVALLYGVQGFGDFLWQLLVLNKADSRTLIVGLMLQVRNIMIDHNEVGVLMAMGTILFVPVLAVYAATSRMFAQGLSLEGVRG